MTVLDATVFLRSRSKEWEKIVLLLRLRFGLRLMSLCFCVDLTPDICEQYDRLLLGCA